jgi:hypothetical protein
MAKAYPIFAFAPYGTNDPSDLWLSPSALWLSPSAATYLILHLLQLKLTEPSYQIDPDAWVRETEATEGGCVSDTFSFGSV